MSSRILLNVVKEDGEYCFLYEKKPRIRLGRFPAFILANGSPVRVFRGGKLLIAGRIEGNGSVDENHFSGLSRAIRVGKRDKGPKREIFPEWFRNGDKVRVSCPASELRVFVHSWPSWWRPRLETRRGK